MKLILIQCCKRKSGRTEVFSSHRSMVDDLPPAAAERLNHLRARVHAKHADKFHDRTLSAAAMYTGGLYSDETKELLRNPPDGVRFLIVSGGYGLLRPDEVIRDYDINIATTATDWTPGLAAVLDAYVRANGITEVHAIVSKSGSYRKVIRPKGASFLVRPILHYVKFPPNSGASGKVPALQAVALARMAAGEAVGAVGGHPVVAV